MIIGQGEGAVAMTGNEAHRVRLDPVGAPTDLDVFVLRFDDTRDGQDMKPYFCRLDIAQFTDRFRLPTGGKALAYVAIGFPPGHQDYEFDWDEETSTVSPGTIRSRWVQVYLDPAEPNDWDKEGLEPFQIDADQVNAIGDLDGLIPNPAD